MSEHTKGRLAILGDRLIPEAHVGRKIGNSTNKAQDKAEFAHDVAIVRGKYQDNEANARRLAACWNAFENVRTDLVEMTVGSGAMQAAADAMEKLPAVQAELTAARALIQQQDAMLGKKACATKECAELLAARALLREVVNDDDEMQADARLLGLGRRADIPPDPEWLVERIRSYLDACDTLEGAS